MSLFVAKDITSQRFGGLVALRYACKNKKHHYWWVRCDCGRVCIRSKSSLRVIISCGRCGSRREDIAGQRFGRLVVIEYAYTRKQKAYWKCICDCGNIRYYQLDYFSKGVISCGCYKKDTYYRDITGYRYGKLLVLHPTDKRESGYHVVWYCLCDCGKHTHASLSELHKGHKLSCGCIKIDGKDLYLYAFRSKNHNLLKIGTSGNVQYRKRELEKELKDSFYVAAHCVATREIETATHNKLKPYRAIHPNQPKGKEWFYPEPEVLSFVERMKMNLVERERNGLNELNLKSYSRALAESILTVALPQGAVSEKDIQELSEQLARDILKSYEDDGKPHGDSEDGLLQYIIQTKVVMKHTEYKENI